MFAKNSYHVMKYFTESCTEILNVSCCGIFIQPIYFDRNKIEDIMQNSRSTFFYPLWGEIISYLNFTKQRAAADIKFQTAFNIRIIHIPFYCSETVYRKIS